MFFRHGCGITERLFGLGLELRMLGVDYKSIQVLPRIHLRTYIHCTI